MYHDCNTDFEKIRKRIEEEKNKCKKCYIQGPTGPKGEIGPTGPKVKTVFQLLMLEKQKLVKQIQMQWWKMLVQIKMLF